MFKRAGNGLSVWCRFQCSNTYDSDRNTHSAVILDPEAVVSSPTKKWSPLPCTSTQYSSNVGLGLAASGRLGARPCTHLERLRRPVTATTTHEQQERHLGTPRSSLREAPPTLYQFICEQHMLRFHPNSVDVPWDCELTLVHSINDQGDRVTLSLCSVPRCPIHHSVRPL